MYRIQRAICTALIVITGRMRCLARSKKSPPFGSVCVPPDGNHGNPHDWNWTAKQQNEQQARARSEGIDSPSVEKIVAR